MHRAALSWSRIPTRSPIGLGRRRALGAALAGLALAGCAVGPDFAPPAAPTVPDASHPYTEAALPARTASAPGHGGAAQRTDSTLDVPALWWELFRSPALDALVRSALERSPTLAAAQAALRQAQALYAAGEGSRLWPAVTGGAGVGRQRASQFVSGVPGGATYTLYNASVNVSYTVDAFGGVRRELEALQAGVDLQRWQLEATQLALSANVVTAAIQDASLRAQIDATRSIIEAQQRALDVIERQFALGAVPLSAAVAQRTLLAQTQATLPPLQKVRVQNRQLLAVLAGRLPAEGGVPEFGLDALQLPETLPLSLPSALVRQRPDIQASEAQLHQASALVGVATANLYPQITLSASVGAQSIDAGKLFSGPASAWSLGAAVLQPIFDAGALRSRQQAAQAALEQAQAQYRQTVLDAFLNVANTLQALDSDAQALCTQAEAEALARRTLDLVEVQYRAGAVGVLALLVAQRAVQETRIGVVQAQAARYADTAALFQALGGGWWNRADVPAATAASD